MKARIGMAKGAARGGVPTGVLIAGAVCVLALPSAVLAFSNRLDVAADRLSTRLVSGDEAAEALGASQARSLAQGRGFRFTPAGTPSRPDRAVTVAVRVDPQVAREIIVEGRRVARAGKGAAPTPLQLAPSAFKLGVSRGYHSFAQTIVPPVEKRANEIPDLADFPTGIAPRNGTSRFAPRITLDERAPLGRAPRTFGGEGEDRVDVGGSLRLTRNLDVTAGVRYSSQDRDRLRPLTDGKQDNQAVYVGTQFRF
ncbi:MAG: hypothetical protein RIQ46_1847 [Pseudomonadota bacterium]